jgi:opacity protein-like surface antigen
MRRGLTAIALVVLMWDSTGARAEDAPTAMFTFSGFGTLGLVHSSEQNADFVANFFQPSGAGFSHSWSADVDSRLGAQVTANFTPRISAMVQAIAELRDDGTYSPEVEWANVKYRFTPDFYIRLGRIAFPSFLVSDYRNVGYANPWVRPPLEVYSLVPVDANDGVDASYRLRAGEFTNTVQVTYGQRDVRETSGSIDKARRVWGITDTVERGSLTVRGTYQHGNVTVASINALFAAFRQFGPAGIALANKYDSDAKPFDFVGVGGIYDPGGWFVMGEWGTTESHSALGKRSAWYGSGGYRFGKITPYVTYAETRADSNTSDPGLNASAFPPELAGAIAGLNAGLNAVLRTIPVQKTLSIGARWDFWKNVDLKLQYEHIRLGAGSAGTLNNVQPGFQPGSALNVFSAAVDFVF